MIHPHSLIRAPNGDYEFGVIPEIPPMGPNGRIFRAGPIRLQAGTPAMGLLHIQMRHAAKIAHYHPNRSVEDFIFDIGQRYERIIRQEQDTLVLMRYGAVTRCAVVAEFVHEDTPFYRIITAYPMPRETNWAKRNATMIWER
jgi:hypothetical protein